MTKPDGYVYSFHTVGVCAKTITVQILPRGIVGEVRFEGGCHGYSQALPAVIRGMKAETVVKRLRGINCNMRGTSCADQLAQCLQLILNTRKKQGKTRKGKGDKR